MPDTPYQIHIASLRNNVRAAEVAYLRDRTAETHAAMITAREELHAYQYNNRPVTIHAAPMSDSHPATWTEIDTSTATDDQRTAADDSFRTLYRQYIEAVEAANRRATSRPEAATAAATREEVQPMPQSENTATAAAPYNEETASQQELYMHDKFRCSHCNAVKDITERSARRRYDDQSICIECKRLYYRMCSNCNRMELSDQIINSNGNNYCRTCVSRYFLTCTACARKVHRQHMIEYLTMDGETKTVCYNCGRSSTWQCNACNSYFEDGIDPAMEHDSARICESCASDYTQCHRCGEIISRGNEHDHADSHGNTHHYCSSCYDNLFNFLQSYMYKPCANFLPVNPPPVIGHYGIELEINGGRSVRPSDCAERLCTITDDIYCKTDSSLDDGYGLEIVTHPATLEYHMNEFKWREILDTARRAGYKSHDCKTCGIHVHASRELFGTSQNEQDLTIAKMMLLFDRLWTSFIVPFSRRDIESISHWSGKPDASIDQSDNEETAQYKAKSAGSHTRYKAININNRHTVEIRIFRGSLNYLTLISAIQFVDLFISHCRKTPLKDIFNDTWQAMLLESPYPEIKEYMQIRELLTDHA